MRRIIEIFVVTVVLLLVAKCAMAETNLVNTPSGSYLVIQNGSTTSIIQTAKGTGPTILPVVPVAPGASGWSTVLTPSGTYIVDSKGNSVQVAK